jgi:hypothetical protein
MSEYECPECGDGFAAYPYLLDHARDEHDVLTPEELEANQ